MFANYLFVCLFVCLFGLLWHIKLCRLFNDKSILYKKQFYFKQFSLIGKKHLFQVILFSEIVLFQTIHFSTSIDFLFTQR